MAEVKRVRQDVPPETKSTTEIKVETVVALGNFGRALDVKQIDRFQNGGSSGMEGTTSFSDRFQAIALKRSTPRTSGFVFKSGKLLCVSHGSEMDAKAISKSMLNVVLQIIYPGKPPSQFGEFDQAKIHHVVGSFETGFNIQLEHMQLTHIKEGKVTYEPEVYRHLLLELTAPANVTVIVTSQGKITISGKSEIELREAKRIIVPLLARFARRSPNYAL